jgi:hypothetical protein
MREELSQGQCYSAWQSPMLLSLQISLPGHTRAIRVHRRGAILDQSFIQECNSVCNLQCSMLPVAFHRVGQSSMLSHPMTVLVADFHP